jgi:hypothetical protein
MDINLKDVEQIKKWQNLMHVEWQLILKLSKKIFSPKNSISIQSVLNRTFLFKKKIFFFL